MRKFILFISCCFVALTFNAQQINWINFSDLPSKMREGKKPIMIFIYTDWCKYCNMQDAITFSNDTVINNLNNNYYCVKFNVETTDSIVFLGKVYNFIKTGVGTGEHELATFLANKNGKVVYPATVFFNDKFQFVSTFQGYLSKDKIKQIL